MALNVTTAAFQSGSRAARTAALWQYDYGQELNIVGLSLPDVWEAHFSNTPKIGESTTSLGSGTRVHIPDAYLATGQTVYCWIFLHEGTTDGETEFSIVIPVNQRPIPTDIEPTPEEQTTITQLVAALNDAVGRTDADAESAEISAIDAGKSADRAEQAATTAGYMFFDIDDEGHLIYQKTDNVDVDFEISPDGHLLISGEEE